MNRAGQGHERAARGPAPVSPRARRAGDGPWPHLLLAWPAVALVGLFVVPLGIITAVSFFRRLPAGFFEPAFLIDSYRRALEPFHLERLAVSVGLALLATAICLLVGVPFTYLLARRPRRRQVPFLVLILASLSLSEVIVSFTWSVLLSRTSGVSNLLVWLGFRADPAAWSPGLAAVVLAYVFVALPLAVLSLYPTMSRLNPELPEAASTMGASPLRGFFTVVLPLVRAPIAATGALVFIFVLGAYVIPQTLGRPAQWTIPVHITDQAVMKANLPLASALAIVLLLASAVVSLAILALGARRRMA